MKHRRWRPAAANHAGTFRLVALLTIAASLMVWRNFGVALRHFVPYVASDIAGYAHIVDGDTLDVAGTRIRLEGIDAPESSQTCAVNTRSYACGELATQALAGLVRGHLVRCEPSGLDRYGRTLARCRLDDGNMVINSWLVRQGLALSHYTLDYVADEFSARIAGRGLWAGTFQSPWDYRAEVRTESTHRSRAYRR
jgi:endonuclease YncB( thermonuclease family)